MSRFSWSLVLALLAVGSVSAEDWPMYGRDRSHNAVSPEKNAPTDWQNELRDDKGVVTKKARNIAWTAELGSRNLGGPVIADGLVWVGTNNFRPRDPEFKKDTSVLMCFREKDGKFLWQYVSPRLKEYVQDGPHHSMGSTPLVAGDRLWLVTNRCEALCLDIGPLQRGEGVPKELWKVDMREKFGVFPHAPLMAMGFTPSVAADAERVYVVTGNGVDEGHVKIPAPDAPSLIAFDKKTGREVWQDNSPGKGILHCQRSSPLVIDIKKQTQVIVGQGDGWLRSFDAKTGKLIWKCDLNPKDAKYTLGGRGTRNYVMATPVFHNGLVYICPGRDPEHYEGPGFIYCIDPSKEGDISLELDDGKGKGKPNPAAAVVWRYGGPAGKGAERDYLFGRTLSNVVVHDGLAYACELAGYAYCFDAKTGKLHWQHDLKAGVWASPLWVDGKVYLADEDGIVWIFRHGKEKKQLAEIDMEEATHCAPVFANGTLYIMSDRRLYAIRQPK